MDSEVTINLGKLSQILAAVGNSSYQVEHILTIVKSLSASPKIKNEPKSQEPQKNIPCQIAEEIDNLGITSDGKQPKIEEVLADPLCTSEINQSEEGDLHDMMKEGEYQDYFESWFQEATRLQHHFLLQHLLLQKQVSRLVIHIQVIIATTFSYVDKGIFLILLHTWLHWKNSYN